MSIFFGVIIVILIAIAVSKSGNKNGKSWKEHIVNLKGYDIDINDPKFIAMMDRSKEIDNSNMSESEKKKEREKLDVELNAYLGTEQNEIQEEKSGSREGQTLRKEQIKRQSESYKLRTSTEISLVNEFKFNIPNDIFSLLWIADGKFQNWNFAKKDERIETMSVGGIEISFFSGGSFTDGEPSLIHSNLPIRKPTAESKNDKIGYYPTYRELTPERRYIYLKWLENPFEAQNIDIGYVFIFYYGLERHLWSGNSEVAIKAILKLIYAYKDNSSFLNYATNSILFYSLITKDEELMKKIILENDLFLFGLSIYCKYLINDGFSAKDIISLDTSVGFKNRRYIHSDYELFEAVLEDYIFQAFGHKKIPTSIIDIEKLPDIPVRGFINSTLNAEEFIIKDILADQKLTSLFFQLLVNTHERVKALLKEKRKKQKQVQ